MASIMWWVFRSSAIFSSRINYNVTVFHEIRHIYPRHYSTRRRKPPINTQPKVYNYVDKLLWLEIENILFGFKILIVESSRFPFCKWKIPMLWLGQVCTNLRPCRQVGSRTTLWMHSGSRTRWASGSAWETRAPSGYFVEGSRSVTTCREGMCKFNLL